MASFVYDDGFENMVDDDGKKVSNAKMEVKTEMYRLEHVIDYDQYLDKKLPEEAAIVQDISTIENQQKAKDKKGDTTHSYKKYSETEKDGLFFLVFEKGLSVRAAATRLGIKPRTAQNWVQKGQDELVDELRARAERRPFEISKDSSRPVGRPVGRPAKLEEKHKEYLINLMDRNPSLVLDEMKESLNKQFPGLEVKKTTLYRFVKDKCNINLKRAHFCNVDRDIPEVKE